MRSAQTIRDDIISQLSTVVDPELGIDLVNLGLIYTIDLDDHGICLIEMTLTTIGCPLTEYLIKEVQTAVNQVAEVRSVDVQFVWEPAWSPQRLSRAAKLALGIHNNSH